MQNNLFNSLYKPHMKPYYPFYRNYFVLGKKNYDIELLKKDMKLAINNIQNGWVDKNKSKTWSSITLKSEDGKDQSFLKNTKFGIGDKNIYAYTDAMRNCNYFKKILEEIPTDIYLVRILRLDAGGKISFHTDESIFKEKNNIIRCHLPIITNPYVKFQIGKPTKLPLFKDSVWGADVIYERHLEAGKLWYTNVNTLHGVENNGTISRYHLAIDMRPPFNI